MLGFLRNWRAGLSVPGTVDAPAPTAWRVHAGFAHPDWGPLETAPRAEGWLRHLLAQVGSHFRLDRSRNFHLLSPFSARKASYQMQFLELTLGRLVRLLGVESKRPHVVLIWRNPDEYWRYVSYYTGSSGGSVGVCIREGLVHTVTYAESVSADSAGVVSATTRGPRSGTTYDRDVDGLQATLAHELVHDLLSESQLPLWLEEGICQTFTTSGLEGIAKGADHLRKLATSQGLADFWSGRGFAAEEIQQKFCYSLAEILTRLLLDETNFRAFLAEAERSDCGQEACRKALGRSLGSFLGTFLGPGAWEPPVSKVHELWALLHESRWEQAIEVAGPADDPLLRLGKALALCETARWREGLAELGSLPWEFKSVEVLVREFWLRLCTEEADCEEILAQLQSLGHPTESLRGAWMYALGRYEEAKDSEDWAAWARWKLGEPTSLAERQDFNARLLQVEFCLDAREVERAHILIGDCLRLHSEGITTWQLAGRVAELRGQVEEARRAYRRCLEIFDRTGRAWKPERERVEYARERLAALGSGSMPRRDCDIGFD